MAKDPIERYLLHRTSRLERSARLRPMQAAEIMDLAFRVYQTFGLSLLKVTAIPALFCFASLMFWTEIVLPGLTRTSDASNLNVQVGEAMVSLSVAILAGGPLMLIGLSYATAVTVHLVSDFVGGRIPNEAAARAGARKSMGRLFWLNLREVFQAWSGILLSFGALGLSAMISDSAGSGSFLPILVSLVAIFGFLIGMCVLPWVMARHALAPAAIVLEDLRPGPAVSRSLQLMKGTPWSPSGYGAVVLLFLVELMLLFLIWVGAASSLGFLGLADRAQSLSEYPVVSAFATKFLSLFPLFLAVWIIIPVWCTTTTLLYYERRIRLEGYDILALAQEVWRSDRQNRFEL